MSPYHHVALLLCLCVALPPCCHAIIVPPCHCAAPPQATIWVDVESLKEWEEIKRRRPKGKEAMLEEWRGRFTNGFGDFELSGKRLQEHAAPPRIPPS